MCVQFGLELRVKLTGFREFDTIATCVRSFISKPAFLPFTLLWRAFEQLRMRHETEHLESRGMNDGREALSLSRLRFVAV